MNIELINRIKKLLPVLSDRRLVEAIIDQGQHMVLKEGQQMMDYGQTIRFIPIVLNGLIKIMSQGDEGKDIFLYYLSDGNTCPSAFSCCINTTLSDIKAIVVEEGTEIIALPSQVLKDWMIEFPTWKNFVMSSFHYRFKELLQVVDEIAYSKIDERLVKYLTKKSKLTGQLNIQTTHQQIANDLNSSREAISRLLKKMENMNYLKLSRNMITIIELPN
jgi:CRP/FNR family transcriptional regulator, anaerobic regulatory protein